MRCARGQQETARRNHERVNNYSSQGAHGLKTDQHQPRTQEVWQHLQVPNPGLTAETLSCSITAKPDKITGLPTAMPMNMNLASLWHRASC